MPEQLTKHPDVTLQVLRSAGAKCGEGAAQTILTQCPAPRFCRLPGGELCIYGLPEAPTMTQISPAEWQAVLQAMSPRDESAAAGVGAELLVTAAVALAVGAGLGAILGRRKR
jgi:hypothetical protein